ncbi:hypothetical protein LMG26411_06695 [Cupriavidus numazuensis]|uniref:Uncharacterized protein n=1 Tax=Cupriavidus numazuensis TaxID=221992 RepID=A0ABM8TST4_9BURK|nr:hypothetical protein LMG26411_06695 [Cupriavidus numazuensis]
MNQAIFSRARRAGGRRNVSCACRPAIGASPGCHQGAGGGQLQLGLSTELSPVCHRRMPGPPRFADSPACDAISQFDTYRLDCHRLVLLRRAAPLRRRVTLALHARNAKKILSRKRSLESTIVFYFACNACEIDTIFSENASVSYVVDSSIDCMMLNRNRTTDFPHWTTFVRTLVPVAATHSQGALLPCTGEWGAS